MKLLLDLGNVNPNSPDANGLTPLLYSLSEGHRGVVKLLLESRDINPNSLDRFGLTPLWYAARWERQDLVEVLLGRRDVNPHSLDNGGQTPLPYALVRKLVLPGQPLLEVGSPWGSLEDPDRMPPPVACEIAPLREVTHPLTATDDVTLRTVDDCPFDVPTSAKPASVPSGPSQKQPILPKNPPPDKSYLYLASLILISGLGSSLGYPFFLLALILFIFYFSLF